ncbi:hypothetical protein CLAFUW4_06713 [Fulvia fulva]|uniref:Peptidase A1 domain-containing protein n=1 Tax=Passalora fulva TaxID=5499 RepID=A0A9Q8P9T4_PASFU|nr:uncharacterized protein CLAFUR5_06855 [Fulvia fulva]KAK4621782.1 hypothetical protein CLAFUR4_06721 [Fulvia fulva]KAK4623077.1 hypothetical protein CLAFUR0_06715 [Fulvia fulva]UJO18437.1 hypothetical protein CLAFUR5_06855 [Fulvia fulva]WPV16147.1 hypothetical protein CLAFUW4_06713 [Fulvia fulva]WPV30739.1 hypothetical protein CLAFUW7_06712 [Fulvia fulva]
MDMALSTRSMEIPAPFIVAPTGRWEGNDGNWSTFAFTVGSPAQHFRGLPSLIGLEIWVPMTPDACVNVMADQIECMFSRGAVDGGFMSNTSSTWSQIDIFQLPDQAYLYGQDNNALFGTDDVTLAGVDGSTLSCTAQTVAGFATTDFWMGTFGLGVNHTAFGGSVHPSFLALLRDQSSIPSLSFGYTAGASYEASHGSLVLGGYDEACFEATNLSVPIVRDSGSLRLMVQKCRTEERGKSSALALR